MAYEIKKNLDFLIFDSDCGFCQRSIEVMKKLTGDSIDYVPSFEFENDFYGLTSDSFASSIKFFENKEKHEALNEHEKIQKYENHEVHETANIYHGAYAIFKALSHNPFFLPLLLLYEWFPLFDVITEAGYRIIARNRMKISEAIGADACKVRIPNS